MTEKWTIKKMWCIGCFSDKWHADHPKRWGRCFESHDKAVEYVDEQLAAAHL